jgi:hypothetical protein
MSIGLILGMGNYSQHIRNTVKNTCNCTKNLRGLSPRSNYTGRRLWAKLAPTFADRGSQVVRVTNLYGRNFGFLGRDATTITTKIEMLGSICIGMQVCCDVPFLAQFSDINLLYVSTTSLYPQKLALTSLARGGHSVGIVRSRIKDTEFFWGVSKAAFSCLQIFYVMFIYSSCSTCLSPKPNIIKEF